MDISLKVLNRYVKVDDQDPKELADKITSIGLEVEGIHDLTRGNNMTIGYVKMCIRDRVKVKNSSMVMIMGHTILKMIVLKDVYKRQIWL